MSFQINPKLALKIQDNPQNINSLGKNDKSNDAPKTSFSDLVSSAFEETVTHGHEVENMGAQSHNTTDLALAMDQFLMEISTLKAVVDEARKAIDRLFQEGKG